MKKLRLVAALALLVFSTSFGRAAALSWDPNSTVGTSLGGSGTWDQSSLHWYNGLVDISWNNALGTDAIFTGTGGTATLTTSITAADLYFTNLTSSVLITNGTGSPSLTLSTGIVDTGGGDEIISATLAGSATLTKNGGGTLELSGANSGFSGAVQVNQGVVEVESTSALGTGAVTVTNAASVEYTTAGTLANAFFISGSGGTNSGSVVNVVNTNIFSGLFTLESTNIVFGAEAGIFDFEGGITVASGVNANVTLNGTAKVRMSYTTGSKPINFGTGSLTLNGANLNIESTAITYSGLSLSNGAQIASSEKDPSLGTVPSSFVANYITLNGGLLQFSHTLTISGNRGIYLGPGGGALQENTGAAAITIPGAISGPGALHIEVDGSGSSVDLQGANTYSGGTLVDSGVGLTVNGTAGTFGTGNLTNNGTTSINRSGTLTYGGAISGTGTLTIAGDLVATFSGGSTYSGATTLENYLFLAENTNASATGTGAVTVNDGSTLGGDGIIAGPVTIDSGSYLQPGYVPNTAVGMLTISNKLTLVSGSATTLEMDATVPTNSSVQGLTSVTFGGTLNVDIINGSPAAGQTYQLFKAASYSGVFDGGINLPGLSGGLSWNTNELYTTGTISVVGQNGVFNPPVVSSGTNLVLSGTFGTPGGTYSILTSTNLAIPFADWTVLSSGNPFDGSGNFIFTNVVNHTLPPQFFIISTP